MDTCLDVQVQRLTLGCGLGPRKVAGGVATPPAGWGRATQTAGQLLLDSFRAIINVKGYFLALLYLTLPYWVRRQRRISTASSIS
jgi:hypothetical protein